MSDQKDQSTSTPQRFELNLFQKIIKIMEKVSYIEKSGNVQMTANSSYKAILHDDVTALLHPHCTEWGIVVIPSITKVEVTELRNEKKYGNNPPETKISYRADVWIDVEFINADKPEEKIITKSFSYAIDSGDKATGKAYSMAVKYSYLKTFMLQSGDNEEDRDFEKQFNENKNQHTNNRTQQNSSRNNSANNGNNSQNQRVSNETSNRNNSTSSNGSNHGQSNQQKESGQKVSQASENQIKAIKSLCDKKGIQVSEKFQSSERCSSQEASSEISRINAIKV